MDNIKSDFAGLFKKFRLRSGFATLAEFANVLAQEGYIYDDSLFSHWQKNKRIPKDRRLLLTILKIFLARNGIYSLKDINKFLESAKQGYLTEDELTQISVQSDFFVKLPSPAKVLTFLLNTAGSKKLKRTGWKMEKINNPESIAEHSFQLSIIAMVFADHFGLDTERLIKMAIVHDLGELVTGDIVWTRGKIWDIEKRKAKEISELLGIIKIFKTIDKANEFKKIFEEMMERKTPEAIIFWQLDKVEMAIQALEYEKETGKNLEEFFVSSDLQIQSPFLRKIFKEVLKQRPKNR